MKTLQFKCELLSDVILNVKTATEGNQSTLDFIPGSCFMGIVASQFENFDTKVIDLLFSGKVRFGDAHLAGDLEGQAYRSLHVPASMMYRKLFDLSDGCYLHHFYKREKDTKGTNGHPMQLKQSRNGYYVFTRQDAFKVNTEKSFAIKSAYDREARRAKDEQMYGYESLDKGAVFLFEIECDEENLANIVENSLLGNRRIGRSRTAQYGLVNIERYSFKNADSRKTGISIDGKHYITVYADGRLIFTDKNGCMTFTPQASDFGMSGKICWDKSQIRTFQYAPYNYKRRCRDFDRCGIEKGSVIVIETDDEAPTQLSYVGSYRNEGFGKVIYNPYFLDMASNAQNGECACHFAKATIEEKDELHATGKETALLSFLRVKEKEEQIKAYIYKIVNDYTNRHATHFKKESFASQWGTIRSIAMRCGNVSELRSELFTKTRTVHHSPTLTDDRDYDKNVPSAYLDHGVAADKWRGQRKDSLENFINEVAQQNSLYGRDITMEAVVNLASEMAKKCSKNGKK